MFTSLEEWENGKRYSSRNGSIELLHNLFETAKGMCLFHLKSGKMDKVEYKKCNSQLLRNYLK